MLSFFIFPSSDVVVMLILGWIIFFITIRLILSKREEKVRGRKMSAMSELMAYGTFPIAAGDVHYAITSSLFMKELPGRETVKKIVQDNLLFYKRFRSVPQGSYWNEVDVNLDEHILSITVENQKALERELEVIMNRPIPTNRPRWEFVLIENLELSSDTTSTYEPSPTAKTTAPYHATLIRIDHCIADGVSLVEVFAKLITDFDGQSLSTQGLVGLKRRCSSKAFRFSRVLLKVIRGIFVTLWMAVGPYDTATKFTASMEDKKRGLVFSHDQRLAMAGPWSLEYIKTLKSSLGVSLNDIFMAAFAGAIRRYCIEEEDDHFQQQTTTKGSKVLCRALLPFAFLRNPKVFKDADAALTNNWTLVSSEFAVNENTRLDRVMKTQQIMTKMKRNLQPISNAFVNTIGSSILPRSLMQKTLWDTYNRHSIVFGNVPGAPAKVRFCGSVVEETQTLFCGALPQVEIFTYAGRVFFNIVADPKIIADPKKIVQFFSDELKGLGRDCGVTLSLEFEPNCNSSSLEMTQSELSLGDSSVAESDANDFKKSR